MGRATVLTLVGSLRAASINRQLAEVAAHAAPDHVDVITYDGLDEIPFYNEDIDTDDPPATVGALRAAVADADAVLIVTPEYNGTIPAVLKNAIDWLSRPYGNSAITGKPLAVVGTAMGRFGGVWAHDDTRKSFGIAGARVVDSVTLSLPVAALDGKHPRESAEVTDSLREILAELVAQPD
jgi:NAD(P)H-dependent FMN reductase